MIPITASFRQELLEPSPRVNFSFYIYRCHAGEIFEVKQADTQPPSETRYDVKVFGDASWITIAGATFILSSRGFDKEFKLETASYVGGSTLLTALTKTSMTLDNSDYGALSAFKYNVSSRVDYKKLPSYESSVQGKTLMEIQSPSMSAVLDNSDYFLLDEENRKGMLYVRQTVGTVTSLTATSITDTSLSLLTDQLRGYSIHIIDGKARGERFWVSSNTATVLTLAPNPVSKGVIIGDKFRVVQENDCMARLDIGVYGVDGQCQVFGGFIDTYQIKRSSANRTVSLSVSGYQSRWDNVPGYFATETVEGKNVVTIDNGIIPVSMSATSISLGTKMIEFSIDKKQTIGNINRIESPIFLGRTGYRTVKFTPSLHAWLDSGDVINIGTGQTFTLKGHDALRCQLEIVPLYVTQIKNTITSYIAQFSGDKSSLQSTSDISPVMFGFVDGIKKRPLFDFDILRYGVSGVAGASFQNFDQPFANNNDVYSCTEYQYTMSFIPGVLTCIPILHAYNAAPYDDLLMMVSDDQPRGAAIRIESGRGLVGGSIIANYLKSSDKSVSTYSDTDWASIPISLDSTAGLSHDGIVEWSSIASWKTETLSNSDFPGTTIGGYWMRFRFWKGTNSDAFLRRLLPIQSFYDIDGSEFRCAFDIDSFNGEDKQSITFRPKESDRYSSTYDVAINYRGVPTSAVAQSCLFWANTGSAMQDVTLSSYTLTKYLLQPLGNPSIQSGSFKVSSVSKVGNTYYCGIGPEIWRLSDKEGWTKVYRIPRQHSILYGSPIFNINKIAIDSQNRVTGIAYIDILYDDACPSMWIPDGGMSVPLKPSPDPPYIRSFDHASGGMVFKYDTNTTAYDKMIAGQGRAIGAFAEGGIIPWDYCFRIGNSQATGGNPGLLNVGQQFGLVTINAGENICIPFKQKVFASHSLEADVQGPIRFHVVNQMTGLLSQIAGAKIGYLTNSKASQEVPPVVDLPYGVSIGLERGFYAVGSSYNYTFYTAQTSSGALFTLGQAKTFAFNRTTDKWIYSLRNDTINHNEWLIDQTIVPGTPSNLLSRLGKMHSNLLCMAIADTPTDLYLSEIDWNDAGSIFSISYVRKVNLSTTTLTTLLTLTTPPSPAVLGNSALTDFEAACLISICHDKTNNVLHGCILDRKTLLYYWWVFNLANNEWTTANVSADFIYDGTQVLSHLYEISGTVYGVLIDKVFNTFPMRLVSATYSAQTITIKHESFFPANEMDIIDSSIDTTDNSIVYAAYPSGNIYLWGKTILSRVENADFTNMSIRESLTELAKLSSSYILVKPNGKVLYKPRTFKGDSITLDTNWGTMNEPQFWSYGIDGISIGSRGGSSRTNARTRFGSFWQNAKVINLGKSGLGKNDAYNEIEGYLWFEWLFKDRLKGTFVGRFMPHVELLDKVTVILPRSYLDVSNVTWKVIDINNQLDGHTKLTLIEA